MRELFEAEHLGNWDSCDWFCVKVLGRMLQASETPQVLADELVSWTTGDHLWLRRARLVAFVNLAPRGDAAFESLTARVLEGAEKERRRLAPLRTDQRGVDPARAVKGRACRGR